METQTTALPNLFIGIDIHKKTWSIHIKSDISDHKSFTMPAEPKILFDYVDSNFPTYQVNLVYEAGCCGFSAARYFLQLGWTVTVVNLADIPTSNKQYYQKTDQLDCRNLSKQLALGQLKGIHIPLAEEDELKSLLRHRAGVTRQLRAAKTHIKSLLLYQGIVIPPEHDNANWTKSFIAWLKNLQWQTVSGKYCLESKLRTYEFIYGEYLELANQLRSYCRKHYKKDYYLLKSIPGVGGYLAAALLAELGDIRRFSNEASFASYIGMVPMMRSSGGTENVFGITPRCRGLLRSYIIESAWVALRIDPQMQLYYRTHIGKNPKSIIVKIARKLLNRILSVIKTETPYQNNYQKTLVMT
ncbi:IS110 family transposase [Pedobacter changchengzhani]|uniref:IS110 family transposase n=1 Tax=Pedobacter changchengzhani TaxID=2529274 RepID=A0A4R5MK83_9SPHI|nr:IS110 family transposase [Pedobacter changchengzhani]TDG35978.1 IS110 family transposase [Pedobacter changchengzhani]